MAQPSSCSPTQPGGNASSQCSPLNVFNLVDPAFWLMDVIGEGGIRGDSTPCVPFNEPARIHARVHAITAMLAIPESQMIERSTGMPLA